MNKRIWKVLKIHCVDISDTLLHKDSDGHLFTHQGIKSCFNFLHFSWSEIEKYFIVLHWIYPCIYQGNHNGELSSDIT